MRDGAGRVRVGKGAREYGWRSVEDAREAMGEVTTGPHTLDSGPKTLNAKP